MNKDQELIKLFEDNMTQLKNLSEDATETQRQYLLGVVSGIMSAYIITGEDLNQIKKMNIAIDSYVSSEIEKSLKRIDQLEKRLQNCTKN